MKTLAVILVVGLAAPAVVAEPPMRDKITAAIANADQGPQPPPTAKQMVKHHDAAQPAAQAEATVQLPDYEVTAPLIRNRQKIELNLAKHEIAVHQEEKQLKATTTDKVLNNDAFSVQVGPATFAFGSATASARASEARRRLAVLDVEQTILLTGLTSTDEEQKKLKNLLGRALGPTLY